MSYTTNPKKQNRKSRRQGKKGQKAQLGRRAEYRKQLDRRKDKTRGA